MNIAKLLASAVMLGGPAGMLSAQSRAPADSSHGAHRGEWIAGTGAAAAAGLFLAFAHRARNTDAGANELHGSNASPGVPSNPTGGLTPSPAGGPTQSSTNPVPPDTTTPPDTSSVTPDAPGARNPPTTGADSITFDDGPPTPVDQPPNLPVRSFAPFAPTSSVPEPGSLALTVTGLIGLLPLVRRRR